MFLYFKKWTYQHAFYHVATMAFELQITSFHTKLQTKIITKKSCIAAHVWIEIASKICVNLNGTISYICRCTIHKYTYVLVVMKQIAIRVRVRNFIFIFSHGDNWQRSYFIWMFSALTFLCLLFRGCCLFSISEVILRLIYHVSNLFSLFCSHFGFVCRWIMFDSRFVLLALISILGYNQFLSIYPSIHPSN